MALRALLAVFLLVAGGFAAAEEGGARLRGALHEDATSAEQLRSLQAQTAPEDVPLHVRNNASNGVVLANCLESYALEADEELQTTWLNGGFWVLPEGVDLNCSAGCAECFYMAMQWTPKDGALVRIGFGVDAQGQGEAARPQGGGIELSVLGSASAQCTDESCEAGWTKAVPVDLAASSIQITVHGSKAADRKAGGDDTRRGSGTLRASRFRRPYLRRYLRRRRPVYRPSPWSARPEPSCQHCYQHGAGTCWWMCG